MDPSITAPSTAEMTYEKQQLLKALQEAGRKVVQALDSLLEDYDPTHRGQWRRLAYQQVFDAEDRMRALRRRTRALLLSKPADCSSKYDGHPSEDNVGLNEDDGETVQDKSSESANGDGDSTEANDGDSTEAEEAESTNGNDSNTTLSMSTKDDKAPQSMDNLLALRHIAKTSEVSRNLVHRHKNAGGDFVFPDNWWVKIGPGEGSSHSNEVDKGYLDHI